MVESVVVDAELRGRGVGETMMRWAMDEARRRGCTMLHLTSNKDRTDAHRFYERLGFAKSHEGLRITL
jgi:GNAT superfamily N-acetyltransferase